MDATPGIKESLIQKSEVYFISTLERAKLNLTKATFLAISIVEFKLLLLALISVLFHISSVEAGIWLSEILGKSYYTFSV